MRTIFAKQLLLYACVLSISFVTLGVALSQAIRGYFIDRQIEFLRESAARLVESFEFILMYGGASGMINNSLINNQVAQMRQYLKADVIVVNEEFGVLIDTGDIAGPGASMRAKETEPLKLGRAVSFYGNPNGVYKEFRLSAGHPLMIGDELVLGFLVTTSAAELEGTIYGMYRITAICLGATMLLSFALVYFSCGRIAKPLKQMNEAAGIIAAGNFERRIEVRSKDETGQLAGRFNQMAEGLQEQETIRRAFLSNLSHDLRTPLTSIRGFIMAISDGTIPAEEQPHYMEIILDETERLIKLSNDMLDIHKIEDAGFTPSLAEFDVNSLIRKTLSQFEKRAHDKRLVINCSFAHGTDYVCADEGMIMRALYNLIDNSVKFTPDQGGIVAVETTVSDRKLTVSVRDNGAGMNPDELRRAFDRFYKGDESRGEDRRGSGLGLSIVREFLKSHGETVSAESEPGVGSAFAFALPWLGREARQ